MIPQKRRATIIFLALVCVRERVTHSEERRERERERREKESASCCFYAVLESQAGELVRTRVRTSILSLPLILIINNKYIK